MLHRAAYTALGLTGWRYDAVDCGVDELPGLLAGLGPEWVGLSVTMPLKQAALAVAGSGSPLATAVGAANTLLPRAGGWYAENTDVTGVREALRAAGRDTVMAAVILGAGGTARAALAALADLGERSPRVVVREPGRAEDLLAAADRLGVSPRLLRWSEGLSPDWDVLVSTVPAGAADGLATGPWPPGGLVLDVVYAPWPTPLAAAAAAAGGPVVGGAEVLLHQAVEQVRLMTGRPAPLSAMRAALPMSRRPPDVAPPWSHPSRHDQVS